MTVACNRITVTGLWPVTVTSGTVWVTNSNPPGRGEWEASAGHGLGAGGPREPLAVPDHVPSPISPLTRGIPRGLCTPTALPTLLYRDPQTTQLWIQQEMRSCAPPCTSQASPTFQQLPELLLLLGDLVQEELGVEVANFGWGQAATCTVLGPVGGHGQRREV